MTFDAREIGPEAGARWVAEVIAGFKRTCAQDGRPEHGSMMAGLIRLHRTNLAQWDLEDEVHRPDASDAAIARGKRGIDGLNAKRHGLIEAVDAAIDGALTQAPGAPPCTESPAMAIDRLSVLVIRIHRTELAGRSAVPAGVGSDGRLPNLYGQLELLERALGVLLDDVRHGRRRFTPYRSFKLYGSEAAPD